MKNGVISLESVKDRLVTVRGELALLDCDVAAFYGVETKRVNEAVKNNPEKFPLGYVRELSQGEVESLRSKISSLETEPGRGHHSKHGYKVFTERGLYMLATILKSHLAVEASFAIIETFANVRAIKRELVALHTETDKRKRASLMKHFGEALTDIVMPDLDTTETESSLELNFIIGKLKHTVRRVRRAGAEERKLKLRELKLKNGVVEFGLMKRDAIVQAASAQIGGIIAKDSVWANFAYNAFDGKTCPVDFAGFGMTSAMERRVA